MCLLHWQADSLPLSHQGSPLVLVYLTAGSLYLMREARIKRAGRWESSATVLAVPSKALGPLVSASASPGLFSPLRNALLLDCSPPSSSVPGISEARILEVVAFPSLLLSHSVLSDSFVTPWTVACQVPLSLDFPIKNTGVSCHFLLQGIFLTRARTWVSCIAGGFFTI